MKTQTLAIASRPTLKKERIVFLKTTSGGRPEKATVSSMICDMLTL